MTKANYLTRYFRRTLPDGVYNLYLRLITAASADTPPCYSDPELWWSNDPMEIRAAKLACKSCPIQSLCLEYAIEGGEAGGVWGGADPRDRALIQRRMKAQKGRIA